MNRWIQFSPEAASTMASRIDSFFLFLVGVSLFFIVVVSGLGTYFALKYRRRSPDEVPLPQRAAIRLEVVWIVIPFLIAMFIFGWGANLYFDIYRMPENAMEVYVTGKQWMWRIQHMNGRREINELHIPVGRKVKLTMTSEDVIHDFFVPAFRVKADVLPGRYTNLWFEAIKPGRYRLFCAEYCGTQHSDMIGWVYAMEPAAFQAWLGGQIPGATLASSGKAIFEQHACNTCHRPDTSGRGPILSGLDGKQVQLDNGETVVADDAYLRESILNSQAKIVAGFQRPSIMPAFQGLIGEEQVLALIAYIKSLDPIESSPMTEPPGSGNQGDTIGNPEPNPGGSDSASSED